MAVTIDGSTGVTYSDNIKHKYGTSGDLEVYHDGSHSYIDGVAAGTGYLILKSKQLQIKNDAADEKMVVADANGSVELYHNGSKKFETLSTGVRAQGGICFGSDTAAVNHLDDYEEGTWTPAATVGSCSSDYARYVKIGSQVTLMFDVSQFSDSSSSDHLQLTGIPFPIVSPEESSGACHGERLNTTLLVAWIDPSNQRIGYRGGFGSSNYAYITFSMITDGTDSNIKTTMTYTTAS